MKIKTRNEKKKKKLSMNQTILRGHVRIFIHRSRP